MKIGVICAIIPAQPCSWRWPPGGTGDKYQTVENLDLLIIGVNIKSSFFLMFSPSLPGELQLTYHTSIYIIRLMKLLIIINLEELTIIPFLVLMK